MFISLSLTHVKSLLFCPYQLIEMHGSSETATKLEVKPSHWNIGGPITIYYQANFRIA